MGGHIQKTPLAKSGQLLQFTNLWPLFTASLIFTFYKMLQRQKTNERAVKKCKKNVPHDDKTILNLQRYSLSQGLFRQHPLQIPGRRLWIMPISRSSHNHWIFLPDAEGPQELTRVWESRPWRYSLQPLISGVYMSLPDDCSADAHSPKFSSQLPTQLPLPCISYPLPSTTCSDSTPRKL